MIRRLMLTSTYQLSSEFSQENFAKDPDDTYLWRMDRKRLDAESLRDSILAVTGALDRKMGGPVATNIGGPSRPGRMTMGNTPESDRRSIYLPIQRGNLNDLFQVFDFPDPSALAGKRYVTTAPTQALYLMNSPFVIAKAKSWAEKLLEETDKSDSDLVQGVYVAAYGRSCLPAEQQKALKFLTDYSNVLAQIEPEAKARRQKVWTGFCQAIIESTEFRFVN